VSHPACLITGIVNDYRREPYRLLAEREDVEVIAWQAAGPPVNGVVIHRTTQAGAVRLAASGRYRAVICSTNGRLALPGSYLAARVRGVPFVLWATMWSHPRTPAHALSRLPMGHLYRNADAVVTYGPHVSAYVRRHRRMDGVFEAPQAVEIERFGREVRPEERARARSRAGVAEDGLLVLFVGRLEREKGVEVLLEAWALARLGPGALLALAGDGPLRALAERAGSAVRPLGYVSGSELPPLYAGADVLVLPSIRTATFVEPWGLVVNEAMLQRTPVIATDAVGATAGGLVRDGRNGLVAPAGDAPALAARLRMLGGSPELRRRLGEAARDDAGQYTPGAWANGVARALEAVGAGAKGRPCYPAARPTV
jgi:glycosyltransferase involved in cell wall biosynthesis